MPTQLPDPVNRTLRQLLADEWTPSNTVGYDPTLTVGDADLLPITFGNYSSSLSDPQISLAQPQGESTVGGQYSGINSGGGQNQFRRGEVIIQCWATEGQDYNGEGAEGIVGLLRKEVERIIHSHDTGVGELWSLSPEWQGRFPDPDDETDPTWQSQILVVYEWNKTPP